MGFFLIFVNVDHMISIANFFGLSVDMRVSKNFNFNEKIKQDKKVLHSYNQFKIELESKIFLAVLKFICKQDLMDS